MIVIIFEYQHQYMESPALYTARTGLKGLENNKKSVITYLDQSFTKKCQKGFRQ